MNYKLPCSKEKTAIIQAIVEQGLRTPQTMKNQLKELILCIGYLNLIRDMGDVLLIVLMLGLGILSVVVIGLGDSLLHTVGYAFAPAIYGLLALITECKERMLGLYDIKMTCKYSLHQLTAVKLLLFSFIGIISSLFLSLAFFPGAFIRSFITSMISLFFFSLIVIESQKWISR